MFLRAILQYADINYETGEESTDLFGLLLFSYKLNSQTALFAGYSDQYVGDETFDLTQSARAFFLKLGYAWVR